MLPFPLVRTMSTVVSRRPAGLSQSSAVSLKATTLLAGVLVKRHQVRLFVVVIDDVEAIFVMHW